MKGDQAVEHSKSACKRRYQLNRTLLNKASLFSELKLGALNKKSGLPTLLAI